MHQNQRPPTDSGTRRFEPWPIGIIAAFGLFIALTAVFVAKAVASRTDLVTHDYYEEELRYQDRLNQLRRTAPWQEQIRVTWADGELKLLMPAEHAAARVTGKLVLYRPSAADHDAEWPLSLNDQGEQRIPAAELAPGLWKARLHWSVGGESYYFDQPLVIHHPGVTSVSR